MISCLALLRRFSQNLWQGPSKKLLALPISEFITFQHGEREKEGDTRR